MISTISRICSRSFLNLINCPLIDNLPNPKFCKLPPTYLRVIWLKNNLEERQTEYGENKGPPLRDVTLLARHVLPRGKLHCTVECYRCRRQTPVSDTSLAPYTMCRPASNKYPPTEAKANTVSSPSNALHEVSEDGYKTISLLVKTVQGK